MQMTEIDLAALPAAAGTIPKDSPVVMLNLVRYNPQADYGDRTDTAPCTGREAYLQRYAPAFNEVAAVEGVSGIQVQYVGSVTALLVGAAGEHWDDIVLVEYPSFAAFRRIVESREYEAIAAPHRKAALQDWRLIATARMALPG